MRNEPTIYPTTIYFTLNLYMFISISKIRKKKHGADLSTECMNLSPSQEFHSVRKKEQNKKELNWRNKKYLPLFC